MILPEGRVGTKGELFPPKELREQAGLEPSSRVSYRVEDGRLIVERIPNLDELLVKQPSVEISLAEFRRFRRELSKRAGV
jgi:bifunctional DNA-binding transcriptional regulator/antitoxin component of YhaV-PrlF toxin-antitoxin module